MVISKAEPVVNRKYILTFKCPDRLGVLGRVSGLMYEKGAFITEISHYGDPDTQTFFSRTVFDNRNSTVGIESFEIALTKLAEELEMEYTLRAKELKPRIIIAVSKFDHCLNLLLTKWRSGALAIDIVAVVSNHDDHREICEFYHIPYYYLPVSNENRKLQEAKIMQLIEKEQVDLFVLARYMQILSDNFCQKLVGQVINIHHSFLPGFKGAKPYHQAHERGVKVIGATAHYVTSDLDEGPIIVQEVKPIDHRVTVEQMIHLGHDLEATALSQAVKYHCEERVVSNGPRTVIL